MPGSEVALAVQMPNGTSNSSGSALAGIGGIATGADHT